MNTQSTAPRGQSGFDHQPAQFVLKGGLAALIALSACGLSQAKEAAALLIKKDGVQRAFITSANKTVIAYKKNIRMVDLTKSSISGFETIYFIEPEEFTDAMALYNARDYKAAKEAFAAAKDTYKNVKDVSGNYSVLAAFYEMECCRKLMDWDGLKTLQKGFDSGPLLRASHKKQLELNTKIWEGVRQKSWPMIASFLDSEGVNNLTVDQRAQVSYCAGLAYEGQEQPIKALNAFNESLISDFGASEVVTQEALKGALRVLSAHPETQEAMKNHGTPKEKSSSRGAGFLTEGYALTELWRKFYGLGKPLPKEFQAFLKYKPEESAVAAAPKEKEPAKEKAKPKGKAK